MLPNLKAFLNNGQMNGLTGRVMNQFNSIPVESFMIDQALAQPIDPMSIPGIDSQPIDANKIAEGKSLFDSIDKGQL